jgi:nucleotide-binding universal stress UspA family protein
MFEMLVNAEQMRDDESAIQVGMAIAGRHNAFVTGLHIVEVFPSTMVMPDVVVVLETEVQEAKERDVWWNDKCRKYGINGAWEVIRGMYVPVLARRSCMADITVSRLPKRDGFVPTGMDYITRVLLAAASPMLLVPPEWDSARRQERILIAWNSTQESMRALRASLPFLREAEMVCFIDGADDELPGIAPPPLPVREWLVRQGVRLHTVEHFNPTHHAGEALLSHAYAMHADLLVMGAWGHSRVSELILGGTTRHVLECAKLPVLLAH